MRPSAAVCASCYAAPREALREGMDEVARYNRERWEELARAGVRFSRPHLDLDPDSARRRVDPEGLLGKLSGKRVLCLAGGGGQQSAAFALLGARVTVLDLSPTQLERDRDTARHYGVRVRTVEGDMRDLSAFSRAAFDVVWHAHSLNFVPDAARVLAEVSRVLCRGGRYRLHWTNPFVHGTGDRWTGSGYLLSERFVDGGRVHYDDPHWDVEQADGSIRRIAGPREFRHSLSTLVNTLASQGLLILGLWETRTDLPVSDGGASSTLTPGSWEHFKSVAPPYLTIVAVKRPALLARARRGTRGARL